ncbi:Hypothetical protein MVR_LOCUS291 [uncultured virus]|nr:Hypothetical protein MVR_LOCUS291 [uncultured virus]
MTDSEPTSSTEPELELELECETELELELELYSETEPELECKETTPLETSISKLQKHCKRVFHDAESCRDYGPSLLQYAVAACNDECMFVCIGTPLTALLISVNELAFQIAGWTSITCDPAHDFITKTKRIIGNSLAHCLIRTSSASILNLGNRVFDETLGLTVDALVEGLSSSFYPDLILSLIRCLLWDGSLSRFSPFITNRPLTIQQLVNSIYENTLLYIFLFEKYISSIPGGEKFRSEFKMPRGIEWTFDNPANPIEQYVITHAEIYRLEFESTGSPSNITLTADQYRATVCEVYDLDRIIDELHDAYPLQPVFESMALFSPTISPCAPIVGAVAIKQFMMRSCITDYVR